MLSWEELNKAKLGEIFATHDLDACCRTIYGAVGWPGKHPGFAVVLAVSRKKYPESHHICLLDEYESSDTYELVRHCRRLNIKWEPELWFGDTENGSAEEFIHEMNEDDERQGHRFDLSETIILTDMDPPHYPYMLGKLKELRDSKRRRLELKESRILSYMSMIESSEEAVLELGDFPALEALMYGVIELLRAVEGQSADSMPEFTGDFDKPTRTLNDLAYIDAIDDFDDDEDEDEGYWFTE
jgi:hypothetical protein